MAALRSYLMGVGQSAEFPLDSLLLAAFVAADSRALRSELVTNNSLRGYRATRT